MAFIFRHTGGAWQPEALPGAASSLPELRLQQSGKKWILITRPGTRVLVNGYGLPTSVRELRHRDTLCLPGGETVFYSDESGAEKRDLLTGESEMKCLRCGEPIGGGPVVRCPVCSGIYHQGERECFTYAGHCATRNCPQSTTLGEGPSWAPETEEEV